MGLSAAVRLFLKYLVESPCGLLYIKCPETLCLYLAIDVSQVGSQCLFHGVLATLLSLLPPPSHGNLLELFTLLLNIYHIDKISHLEGVRLSIKIQQVQHEPLQVCVYISVGLR